MVSKSQLKVISGSFRNGVRNEEKEHEIQKCESTSKEPREVLKKI